MGGAGTYSALGARLFSPPPLSHSIAWIIDLGPDFPSSQLKTWQTSALIRPREGPTTRGWNGYAENEHRSFKYLTEKKRITAQDLPPHFSTSKSFHLICGPERAVETIRSLPQSPSRPIIIWEPVPDLCTPSSLPATLEALKYIDILSPNHEELAALFSSENPTPSLIEQHSATLHSHSPRTAIIVRCGAAGCFVLSSSIKTWLPAYHTDPEKVVDPTGGGNAFLGGLAVGMVRSGGDVLEAAKWGSVSASFAIEQVGMPVLTEGERERWNGVDIQERLEEFTGRCAE